MYTFHFFCSLSVLIVIGTGILFFFFAMSLRKGYLFIPAWILCMNGIILLYQEFTNDWISWAYLWPLLFCAIGFSFILSEQYTQRKSLTCLGKIWLGSGLVFVAVCRILFSINPLWFNWPMIILGSGLIFLLPTISQRYCALRIPGMILLTIGSILMAQWIIKDWASWAYVWALIPASVGLGLIFTGDPASSIKNSGKIVFGISVMTYLIFAVCFANQWQIYRYWPLIVILLGVQNLLQNTRKEKKPGEIISMTKKEVLE